MAHENLEGLSNCTKCHELGEDVKNEKCLDCHKEIKNQFIKKHGFHSLDNIPQKPCYECHSEHHGRDFKLIKFDTDSFNHSKIGFSLTGRHAEINCFDCHKAEYRKNDKIESRDYSFIGLDSKCVNCHEDIHNNTLGKSCENCHTTKAFKPPDLFNHNKTKFRLTGSHVNVSCEKCHLIEEKKDGKKFQHFADVKFDSCSNCHKDVHQGKFGNRCESCHQTTSFNQISNKNKFDHSKTNFPLLGRHKNVKCENCHKSKLTDKVQHERCLDCHEDFHKGQLTKNNKVLDCSECHTVKEFSPSLFSIDDHDKLNFKLMGSHLAIPCKSCHIKNDKWNFNVENKLCTNCHENIHKEEISKKYLLDDNCVSCHNVNSWNEVFFNHSSTNFELQGRHKEINCKKCHFVEIEKQIVQKFRSLKSDCVVCHRDVHKSQFEKDGKTDCTKCHQFSNWNPEVFNHSNSRFPLQGAHQKVECSRCHKLSNDDSYIVYKFSGEIKCANCHS